MHGTDILIAGGGPFGLTLALELGRRGVGVLLVDPKPSTAFNPQANATQARTMEHFRRLGLAARIRTLGLPADHPTDIAYFTRFAGHELARFRLPSSAEAAAMVARNDGPWAAAEAPHRVSQKFVEAELRRAAEALPSVEIRFGWRLTGFSEDDTGLRAGIEAADGSARAEVRARFLIGGDGPRSLVRRTLGLSHEGETGVMRDFFGGRMHAIYLRCPGLHAATGMRPAWMHVTFNADRRAFMAAVDGRGEFAFHTQLRDGEDEDALTEADARAMVHAATGREIPFEILSRASWTAGHALVASAFGRGRVLIGGDAAHLFTPAGGLGYNTAVEDAVNLGWKLAATLSGQAGAGLLATYEAERRPAAIRNTGHARDFARSLGEMRAPPGLEAEGPEGEALRAAAGARLEAHGRREFNIPGITFGTRYDGSAAIQPDGEAPPPESVGDYVPSAVPGGRPPHWWLAPGRSLYDLFGTDWTLLRLGPGAPGTARAEAGAAALGADLRVVDLPLPDLARLYATPLVLIRPDQVVGWRGTTDRAAAEALGAILRRTG